MVSDRSPAWSCPDRSLTVLILLPWLKRARLIGASLLGAGVVVVLLMTTAAYLSDRRDQHTREQLSKQAAEEEAWRHKPFEPARLTLRSASSTAEAVPGGPPAMYIKFCANCHGKNGEGARQGRLNFPPLLDVPAKPRRTVDDIVGLLKDPTAYGLQPPMKSFSTKLTEQQMREIAEWIVKLKR